MGGRSSHQGHSSKHFYFGQVVRKKNYGKDYITVTRPILSKDVYDEWKQKYELAQTMNHKQSLFLPDDYQFNKVKQSATRCGCCCGAEGETQMTYEDVEFLFHSELLNRKSKKALYSESQLFLIMYKLLEGSKQFQRKQISLGDIRPQNILITKQQQIKMVNVASFPSEKTAIDKITENFDNRTVFYLSPEEAQFLKSRGYSSQQAVPNPKTQAFSIGMTILEAATLQSSQQLYKMPSRIIVQDKLEKRLNTVKKSYPLLHEFLSNILKLDPSQRMQSGQCWAALRTYSEKIAELHSFKRNKQAENASIRKFCAGVSTNRS